MILRSFPALRYFLALAAGIFLYTHFNINIRVVWLIVILLLTLVFISIKRPKLHGFKQALTPVFLFLGLISSYYFDDRNYENHYLHKEHFDSYLAVIDSYTEIKPKTYKVIAKVIASKPNEKWEKSSGQVLLYFNKEAGTYPNFGEVFAIRNNLREIEPPKNPLEFDYKNYQQRKNIFSHQFLRKGDFIKTGKHNLNPVFTFANYLNVYTHRVFSSFLETPKQLGVAEALIGGMKAELDFETKQWYSATGAIHVLAVSGMHVAILFWVLNASLGLVLNRKRLPFIITILALLWTYAVFTGLSPSVCRSTVMFSMIQLGIYFRRDDNPVNTLILSAIILLIIMPNWLYDVGFQLSYMAVLGILVLLPSLKSAITFRNRLLRWFWEISMVSIAAQIFTLPLTLYYFHQFPNYFLIANPLVSIVSTLLLPLGLVVLLIYPVPVIGSFLGVILKYTIDVLNGVVFYIQNLPNALTTGLQISILSVALLYLFIWIFVKYLEYPEARYAKSMALIALVLSSMGLYKVYEQNRQLELTFHFIPNGSGLSFIKGRNATFISTDSLVNEPLIHQFHLKNYYDFSGIKNKNTGTIKEKGSWDFEIEKKKIQWIKGRIKTKINPDTDFLLISNNAGYYVENLKAYKGIVILDGSNSKRAIEKIKEENIEPQSKLVVLYDTGSKTFQL
ncbi:MAG: ComEC/Rec2 family competence protein [Spirosomataceae bacterium]